MAVSSTGSGRDQVRVDQVNRKKFGAETTNKTSMGRNDPRRKKK